MINDELSEAEIVDEVIDGRKHPANVLVPILDWYQAQELAKLDKRFRSASHVLRTALSEYLAKLEVADHLRRLAEEALEADDRLQERRAALQAQLSKQKATKAKT